LTKKNVELLSPAGSFEALVVAVANGADAVYIGGKEFNARINSDNFNLSDMKKAINYCHVRGVKVYVAVNTLVTDDELTYALEYVRNLYNLGADAVIIQDMGLFDSVRKIFPDLSLHASTQMTVHNSGGACLLKDMGAEKVIVSREMALSDIKTIIDDVKVPIETFCHGAICMSYSGQCLMSSFMFGRSGNRGVCAQPCRLKYSLSFDDEPTYLLSPHDLCTVVRVKSLCDAGISTLKIEGRMRSPEYVAGVTSAYRKGIDTGNITDVSNLSKVFNRGFTGGFILGDSHNLMNPVRQNNLGLYIGKSIAYDDRTRLMQIKLNEDLTVGDGLRIDSEDGEIGVKVKSIITGKFDRPKDAHKGDTISLKVESAVSCGSQVYKTFDKKFDMWAKDTYCKDKEIRKVGVDVKVVLKEGLPLMLTLSDGINSVSVKSSVIAEKAIKFPMINETLLEQVSKLGNTPFEIKDISFDIDCGLIIPLSELGRVRKDAVSMLEGKRKAVVRVMDEKTFRDNVQKTIVPIHKSKVKKTKLSVHVNDMSGVESAVLSSADEIIVGNGFDPKGKNDVIAMCALVKESGKVLVFGTPTILTDAEVSEVLDIIGVVNPNKVLLSNLGLLKSLSGTGREICLDYPLNVYNTQTAKALSLTDVKRMCVSVELPLSKIKKIKANVDMECIVHGRLPLMTTEHCIFKSKCSRQCEKDIALVDRLNMKFPIKGVYGCRMQVLNCKTLSLIRQMNEFVGFADCIRLDLRAEETDEIKMIIEAYRNSLDGKTFDTIILIGNEFTRGLYF